jgi:hypothetical protein
MHLSHLPRRPRSHQPSRDHRPPPPRSRPTARPIEPELRTRSQSQSPRQSLYAQE